MGCKTMPLVPDVATISALSAVTAVSVYVFLEVIKTAFSDWKKEMNGDTPWWYYAAIRLVALVLGGFFGTILYEEVGGLGSGYPWGTLIGFRVFVFLCFCVCKSLMSFGFF